MGLPQRGDPSFTPQQSTPRPQLKGARVLVVEDEVLVAWELERTLYAAGCTAVRCVAVAADALHELRFWRPHAAVLDIMMRDGLSSVPVADALDDLGVPFVFVSAHGRRELPDRHRERPFLAKPCTASFVVETLGKLASEPVGEGWAHRRP